MSWNPVWEDVFQNQEWGKYPHESLIRFVAKYFYTGQRGNTRLLEVGCGTGPNIWYLSREGFVPWGIDGSLNAIEKAQKRLETEGLKGDLKTGDITRLPYEDTLIDAECVYANTREKTVMILKEIKRVLKNGGLFYSRTFTNEMYVGRRREELGHLEYFNISDGPLVGKGLARLIDRNEALELYGKFFQVLSLDKAEWTRNNGSEKISEWIIICKKEVCHEENLYHR